ncbi:hypothetical protein MBLNU13_g00933t1 [Cladosporium sp. NU13]
MLTNHLGSVLFLLISWLSFNYLPLVSGRVLVRPSVSTLLPYNTDSTSNQYAPQLLDRRFHQPTTTNVTTSDQIYNDLLSFLSSKRLQRRAGKQPAPATDAEFATSTAKGCSMLYMIAANADDALTRLKTNPKLSGLTSSQSQWDNAGALKTYGWVEKKDTVNWAYFSVNNVMKDLGIDPMSKDNVNVQLVQETAVTVDGTSHVASEGVYDQVINLAAGLVIPYYIFSPRHEAQTHNIKGELVPLGQYSDVLFLEYAKLAGRTKGEMVPLKYLLFHNIENPNTWSTVLRALSNKNDGKQDIPLWPGTVFSMNEAEGKALLGTQIGAPLAWMLIQHKNSFEGKSVVKVRVFRSLSMTNRDTDQPYASLLFYVSDAPADNHSSTFPAQTAIE